MGTPCAATCTGALLARWTAALSCSLLSQQSPAAHHYLPWRHMLMMLACLTVIRAGEASRCGKGVAGASMYEGGMRAGCVHNGCMIPQPPCMCREHSMDEAARYLDAARLPQHAPRGQSVVVSAEVFELLRLKDRAMDNTKEGITIADCSHRDMPLIYANEAFARITGYSVAESLGKNCRFLQVCEGAWMHPASTLPCHAHAHADQSGPCMQGSRSPCATGGLACGCAAVSGMHCGPGGLDIL